MNDLVRGVKRVTFTQEGFDASGAQRLSCGGFRSVWKKKKTRKLFSGDEQALCVAAGLCTRNGVCLVAVLCAIRCEEEEGKNKKRQVIQGGKAKVCPVFMCSQRILERESGVALFQGEKAYVRYA